MNNFDKATIETLQKLIKKKNKELSNTPFFLEEERQNLEMEIKAYKRDLIRIKGGETDDR